MTIAIGRSLELYYIDGRPDGMLTADLFNWTGHVLMTPRTQIAAALQRTEAGYAGVYLLLGEQNGEPRAYVGESEDISARIKAHDIAKDWWTSAVLVTAAANKLNKAHVRYLEARLIAEARAIGRMPLDNATNPPRPSLSEADVAKMEAFLENLFIVLPAVRVDMFIQRARPPLGSSAPTPSLALTRPGSALPPARFTLETPKHGIKATAVLVDGEFVVQAGSLAQGNWVGQNGQTASYAALHAELVNADILAPQGALRVFTKNYVFKSPSAAAAVINGRNTSGPQHWRLEGEDITYKEWEARQLAASADPA
jgi:hypothetical protein